MHSNRSNPSQFRVSHLSRQSTVQLYCMAAVWYRYCNVWLLYGTGTTVLSSTLYGECGTGTVGLSEMTKLNFVYRTVYRYRYLDLTGPRSPEKSS